MPSLPRTFVVGDVHGCIDELDDLLRAVGFAGGDHLVFVGDLVAKGPDSAAVVARARELDARAVRGNHEAKILEHRALAERDVRLSRPHREVVASLSDEDWAYLEALPLSLAFPEYESIVVHAGVDPARGLHDQTDDVLLNVRSVREDGTPTPRLEEGVAWASRWTGPTRIVFGHDAIRGLQDTPFALGLDSGCVYGGALTCVELSSWRRYSVRARKAWCPI